MSKPELKTELLDWLEENQPRFIHMADEIWKRPEILWEEFFASKLQADFLEDEGFAVQRDVAGRNTAKALQKAMAKDPNQRFENVGQFIRSMKS